MISGFICQILNLAEAVHVMDSLNPAHFFFFFNPRLSPNQQLKLNFIDSLFLTQVVVSSEFAFLLFLILGQILF